MPSRYNNPGSPGSAAIPIPYPGTVGFGGTIDLTQSMRGIAGRIHAPGQRQSGAWLELTNDSDSGLSITFSQGGGFLFLAPGDRRTFPIPTVETTATWAILYQNPYKVHPAEVLIPIFYDVSDVQDGYPVGNGRQSVNPSTPAASIGPGTLPAGVIGASVASILDFHVTNTVSNNFLNYNVPTTGLFRINAYVSVGNATAEDVQCVVQFTDAHLAGMQGLILSATVVTTGGPLVSPALLSSAATATWGTVGIAMESRVFQAKGGTAIGVFYLDPGGTPNDFVSAIIEQLA